MVLGFNGGKGGIRGTVTLSIVITKIHLMRFNVFLY